MVSRATARPREGRANRPPLHGIRVLDLGLMGVGPWAATLLGALGADVVKIERPTGDPIWFQPPVQKGVPAAYSCLSAYKRSANLDLKKPEDREVFKRLVAQADIVMENMRPGRLGILGFGFEDLAKINSRIIYASCPGWGEEGPLKNLPGVDTHVQVFSGYGQNNGPEGGPPELTRYPILDFISSCFFASTVLLALVARERTGKGMRVTASHLGGAVNVQMTRIAEYFASGKQGGHGSASTIAAPDQAFRCQDGRNVAVSALDDAQWRALCSALEVPQLAEDTRFLTVRDRVRSRKELAAELEALFARMPSRWWAISLEKARVPHSLFIDSQTALDSAQAWANGYLTEVDLPHQGRLFYSPPPWRFSSTPISLTPYSPVPGQHTEVFRTVGFGEEGERSTTTQGQAPPLSPGAPPLTGFKAVEAAEGICGPFLGHLLAQSGAEVVKIESKDGDPARKWASPAGDTPESIVFNALNAGKKSVSMPEGKDAAKALQSLLSHADFLIETDPPAVGLPTIDRRKAARDNPRLLACSISGFGERGPRAGQPFSELAIQAAGSWGTTVGALGQPPVRIGTDICSMGTAVLTYVGLLGGFYHRLRTGRGQQMSTSLLGSVLAFKGGQWASFSHPDEWRGVYCESETSPPHLAYKTKDTPVYFTLHEMTEEDYVSMLVELGLEDMLSDPRFGNAGRDTVGINGRYTLQVWKIWERAFANRTSAEILRMINERNGCAVPSNGYEQLVKEPQVEALGLLGQAVIEGRAWRFVRPPWRGPWQHPAFAPPPALGEHTRAVLLESGVAPALAEKIAKGLNSR